MAIGQISPFDLGSAIQAGQSLVPDFATQELQRRQIAAQEATTALNRDKFVAEQAALAKEAEKLALWQEEFEKVTANPSAAGYARLIALNPDLAEQAKAAHGLMESDQQQSELTAMGSIYAAGKAGNYGLAARQLRQRVEADNAAGTPDEIDQAILAEFESGDPERQRAALGQVGFAVASIVGPERFSAAYGALDTEDEISIVNGVAINKRTGEALWQSPSGPVVTDGLGNLVQLDPISGIPIAAPGGAQAAPAPAAPQAAPAPQQAQPEPQTEFAPVADARAITAEIFGDKATVTDWKRDPNSDLGKANPSSWHTKGGAAVDIRPIPGMTFDQAVQAYKSRGYRIIESRDEVKNPSGHATGPHWHIVVGTYQARSRQEYEKLPKGARYTAPDGTIRIKG